MFTKTLIAASLALTLGTTAYGESYKIDTDGHAEINFEASHLGFSMITGRFDKFEGNFEFDEANPADGSVTVTIDIDSVNTNHTKRDNHLRSADFFDAANHPTASFTSTGINVTGDKAAVISGDLTLRSVTKSVDLDATFSAKGDDPWGNFRAGFSGTTTINLSDYGMEDGPLGDLPITLNINVEGLRQ